MKNRKDINTIMKVFKKHDNIMTTSQLYKEKIFYGDIQEMMEDGLIERVKWGSYLWIYEFNGQEIDIVQKLFPDSILCNDTALYLYGYSNNIPFVWNIAVNENSTKQRLQINYPVVEMHQKSPELFELGKVRDTFYSTKVWIYDRERTICDTLINKNSLDDQELNEIFEKYFNDENKNLEKLKEYAVELGLEEDVNNLIQKWT